VLQLCEFPNIRRLQTMPNRRMKKQRCSTAAMDSAFSDVSFELPPVASFEQGTKKKKKKLLGFSRGKKGGGGAWGIIRE